MRTPLLFLLLLLAGRFVQAAQAQAAESPSKPIQVAVASNFLSTAAKIVSAFSRQSDYNVALIPGSTGKHFAQISHGAPFDVFLAADRHRPERLEQEGLAVRDSRFTYALGQLAFWSPGAGFNIHSAGTAETPVLQTIRTHLLNSNYRFLAIANPQLAPYGRAAKESLEKMGLWEQLSNRIVRGENVSQAFHYVSSGNAQLGLVAYAQLLSGQHINAGDYILLPTDSYSPIQQQAVLLRDRPGARAFMRFLKSPLCLKIIHNNGYPGTGITP